LIISENRQFQGVADFNKDTMCPEYAAQVKVFFNNYLKGQKKNEKRVKNISTGLVSSSKIHPDRFLPRLYSVFVPPITL
jgi:hypothetical protein